MQIKVLSGLGEYILYKRIIMTAVLNKDDYREFTVKVDTEEARITHTVKLLSTICLK